MTIGRAVVAIVEGSAVASAGAVVAVDGKAVAAGVGSAVATAGPGVTADGPVVATVLWSTMEAHERQDRSASGYSRISCHVFGVIGLKRTGATMRQVRQVKRCEVMPELKS